MRSQCFGASRRHRRTVQPRYRQPVKLYERLKAAAVGQCTAMTYLLCPWKGGEVQITIANSYHWHLWCPKKQVISHTVAHLKLRYSLQKILRGQYFLAKHMQLLELVDFIYFLISMINLKSVPEMVAVTRTGNCWTSLGADSVRTALVLLLSILKVNNKSLNQGRGSVNVFLCFCMTDWILFPFFSFFLIAFSWLGFDLFCHKGRLKDNLKPGFGMVKKVTLANCRMVLRNLCILVCHYL